MTATVKQSLHAFGFESSNPRIGATSELQHAVSAVPLSRVLKPAAHPQRMYTTLRLRQVEWLRSYAHAPET